MISNGVCLNVYFKPSVVNSVAKPLLQCSGNKAYPICILSVFSAGIIAKEPTNSPDPFSCTAHRTYITDYSFITIEQKKDFFIILRELPYNQAACFENDSHK